MRAWKGLLCLLVLMLAAGCSEERGGAPSAPTGGTDSAWDSEAAAFAWAIVEQAGWPVGEEYGEVHAEAQCPGGHGPIISFERQPLWESIAHYTAQVRVGPGEHDVIGVHRVVRESRPYRPIRTRESVFLQHGSGKDFTQNYLPGVVYPTVPDDYGLAFHLAQSDIDVWGVDQSSALLPWLGEGAEFLADWGLQRHTDDLDVAVRIARFTRRITGNGNHQMFLSGFSSGVAMGYALINEESQRPPGQRNICGYIPVDYDFLIADPDMQQSCCEWAEEYEELLATGIYAGFSFMLLFGEPAAEDPDGDSELIPGLTNLQAALSVFSWPTGPPHPAHFFAGEFDAGGIATGLQYVETGAFLDFLVVSPPYQTLYALERDLCHLGCPSVDVPWDDHLAEVTVPIFCISAAGGYGSPEDPALGMVGSTDVTTLVIALHDPSEPELDYGHVDLFAAYNAPELVWQPVLEWIMAHSD